VIWALPNTILGLVLTLAALCTGGRAAVVNGVVESHGGAVAFMLRRLVPLRGGASAMTLGHVVAARDPASLERTRAHERVHVRQYERWGPLFIPAYLAGSVWAMLCRRHPYFGNPFEMEAFR